MAADNHWSGRVTITPPLTWSECRLSPAVEDVRLDIHEEDGPNGRILTAVAVLPARASNQWGGHTGDELQSIINAHPKHEFTGSLRVDWAPVYSGEAVLAERWSVAGRTVVHERARLAWSGAPDQALGEARDLALLLKSILDQFPTFLGDYDPSLDDERLPLWAGGEAEMWQRDVEGGE